MIMIYYYNYINDYYILNCVSVIISAFNWLSVVTGDIVLCLLLLVRYNLQ